MRITVGGGGTALLVTMSLSVASVGHAQPAAAPGAAVPPPGQASASPAPAGPAYGTATPPGAALGAAADDTTPSPVPVDLTQARPNGVTAQAAGERAAETSWNAKASLEALRGAAARVDEAWASFLPRLSGIGKYTRLSEITPPNLGTLVAANGPPGPVTVPELQAISFSFPFVFNNWLFQATLTVPISDYFLRINQNYTAATHSHDAAQWDLVGARAVAESDGKVAYYTWLRSRGAVVVAVQALNDQRTHLRDARNQFTVGNASKADVLRAETAVSSAELALEQAKNMADLAEKQLRVAMHVGDDVPLFPGEDLETPLAVVQGNLKGMTTEALSSRPEIKSADANAASAREQVSAARAGSYPTLSAFADGIYANPNPRIFPQTNAWFPSWDVGAQVTWSPNDAVVTNGSIHELESRVAGIEANKNSVRDNVEVEVTQAWQNVQQADFSIQSSVRELASAEEAYRVQRELFNNGRGTSTTLTDAETDLTRARLDLLNAKADARVARIRLDHALGRDAHAPQ